MQLRLSCAECFCHVCLSVGHLLANLHTVLYDDTAPMCMKYTSHLYSDKHRARETGILNHDLGSAHKHPQADVSLSNAPQGPHEHSHESTHGKLDSAHENAHKSLLSHGSHVHFFTCSVSCTRVTDLSPCSRNASKGCKIMSLFSVQPPTLLILFLSLVRDTDLW